VACNRGILERQMRNCRGHVCCRGQGGAGNRVAGTMHACHAGSGKMRECASAVFGVTLCRPPPPSRPRPDMLCLSHPTTQSVLWGPVNVWQRCVRGGDQLDRRRGPVLDEDRLHGFAPPAAREGGCVLALPARVHESALGRATGRAKGGMWGADAATRAGLRRAARQRWEKEHYCLRNLFQLSCDLRSRHGMRSPREHRDADAPGAQLLRRRLHPIDGF
jgi:hypothetical protein